MRKILRLAPLSHNYADLPILAALLMVPFICTAPQSLNPYCPSAPIIAFKQKVVRMEDSEMGTSHIYIYCG